MGDWPTSAVVAVAGALGGILLGLAARLGRFCTLAAIEDALFGSDYKRLQMWAVAMAVSMIGVLLMSGAGFININGSLYHHMPLNPVSWILGGLSFGIGMALCGTCGFGILARIGGGDLRALFSALIFAIAAYMAIAGPTAEFRLLILDHFTLSNSADTPRTLPQVLMLDNWLAAALPFLIAAGLLAWVIFAPSFRISSHYLFWAVTVGLTILFGWWATSWLGADPFDLQPVGSYTFSVPLGQSLIYLMTMSSTPLTFGIGATFGVILGAFSGALIKREFRWEASDDAKEMRRHLLGAFLMGTGGVYAGGCTIGQGLSAASVLSISSPIVLISIWAGVWIGLTYLMEGSVIGAFRILTTRQRSKE